jgi:hypothetical protein
MNACLAIALLIVAMDSLHGETPVARVGDRLIRYEEIQCNRDFLGPRANEPGADLDTLCREAEQAEIVRIIGSELFEAARRKYGIELTADEAAEAVPVKFRGDRIIRQMTEAHRAQGRAALRILRGEPPSRVLEEELSDKAFAAKGIDDVQASGFTAESLRRIFPNVGYAERFLARCTEEHTRRRLEEDFREQLLQRKLSARVRTLAGPSDASPESVMQQFWRDMAREQRVEILDSRYELPASLRGEQ